MVTPRPDKLKLARRINFHNGQSRAFTYEHPLTKQGSLCYYHQKVGNKLFKPGADKTDFRFKSY